MNKLKKTKIFKTGSSQAVCIPAEFHFSTSEVHICRDPQTGDVILSQSSRSWQQIFAALDAAAVPDDFLADRAQGLPKNGKR